ncbi:hypothetical protein [uncultured Gammaproteobacteria bacterium]|nr:hypothetical protein [uncultured Gammaproteobacteria bacterium]
MSDYKSTLHRFLDDPVKFKTGKIGSNARAKRIVQHAPEVMVKITGNTNAENQGNGAIAK